MTGDTSAVSGVGRCIRDLLLNVDKNLIEPILVADWVSQDEITIIPELSASGIKVINRQLGRWFPPNQSWGARHLFSFLRDFRSRVWSLSHLIKEFNIDVVYPNSLPSPDAAVAARKCGKPHIWHLHESVCKNDYLRSYLPCFVVKKIILSYSARTIVVSKRQSEEFFDNYEKSGVRLIYNGIETEKYLSVTADPPLN